MRIRFQKNIFCVVSGFLALALVGASAQAQNFGPAVWELDTPTGQIRGYPSCQAAVDAAIPIYQAHWNDPLVLNATTCEGAVNTSSSPWNFRISYTRTNHPPGSPQFDIDFRPSCNDSGLTFDATRGWSCSPSAALSNIGDCPTCVGNPLQPGFGNKFQRELDYAGSGPFPLRFERVHNSARGLPIVNQSGLVDNFGIGHWTHNYERRVAASGPTQNNNLQAPPVSFTQASVSRPDGKAYFFNLVSGVWTPDVNLKGERLEKLATGWKLTTSEDEIELYDEAGRLQSVSNRAGLMQTLSYFTTGANVGLLQSVTDHFGRTMVFAYQERRLASITLPGGAQLAYGFMTDGTKRLQSVTYPDGKTRTYHYEGPVTGNFNSMLTGITDELGVRLTLWIYEYSLSSPWAGRPILSQHVGGVGKVTLTYQSEPYRVDVTSFVSNTLSATRTYGFQTNFGVIGINTITGPDCPQCGDKETGYNGTIGLVSRGQDWNGFRWNRGFDLTRNLETGRSQGNTAAFTSTPESTLQSYAWHPTFRLPTIFQEPLRITTYVYDPDGTQCGARGALCSKSVQATTDTNGLLGQGATPTGAPRVWTYTYNSNGQVLTVNGPRTDVADTTTYTYYANNDADMAKRGNVATITNAAGHTTQITAYNIHGQPLTIIDPNGLTTTLTYDARQRLTERNVGGEITTYTYDFAGQLTKVTLPDTSFLSYTYDAAHRLTGIEDNLGNKIVYTLDLAGNRTQEQVFDPTNALAQTRSRVYSNINRLFQELGATGQTTEYGYDPQGNVLTVKDPLNRTTTNQYDPLNRVKQVTDTASGLTKYAYNGLHGVTQVTDPRNLITGYAVDGLGNLNQQTSPDTGTTTNTYDPAGNLLTQTDAKGQVTTYAYDALNRVTLITFHDLSTQVYTYDVGTNALGRLTSIAEVNPASVTTSLIAYGYDQKGRVTSETRTVGGVAYTLAYSYDSSGRLTGMTYPSGRTVTYTLDALGRVSQITTTKDSQTQVVAQNIQYHPFGGAKSWTLGNGQIYSRTIDQDGRIASYTVGGTSNAIAYDLASRITGISTNTYGYDNLDRLTSAILPSSNFGYSYDGVGNRLTKTVGANTDTYTYSTTSNRIATLTPASGSPRSFILDANGSTTNDALNSFVYDTRGRMVQSTNSASTVTTYQVNALGQRIRKTNATDDRVFTYDTWGKLIFESDPGGTLKREYLYLGDIPVGVVQ